jgi:hypothetical protein
MTETPNESRARPRKDGDVPDAAVSEQVLNMLVGSASV